jgi:hypothetical protein
LLDLQAREGGIYRMMRDKGQRGGREVRRGRTREGGGRTREGGREREDEREEGVRRRE